MAENIVYRNFKNAMKPVCLIAENDVRTIEERIKALPNVREEEYPEWKEWAEYNFPDVKLHVHNNR